MISPGSITNSVPDPDEFVRNIRDVQRNAQEMASARSGERMQIGAGGILINGGGSLTIAGSGALNVGSGALNSAGSITAATSVSGASVSASGPITGASIAVTGTATAASVATTGDVSASGRVVSTGIVRSPGSRANNVTSSSGYVGMWIDVNGDMGYNPSSAQYKQDFEPADTAAQVDAVLRFALIRYRNIGAVEEHGDAAPWVLGGIAEYMAAGALKDWTFDDADGAVQGINWEQFAIPLIATVQSLDARLKLMERRLAALEKPTA